MAILLRTFIPTKIATPSKALAYITILRSRLLSSGANGLRVFATEIDHTTSTAAMPIGTTHKIGAGERCDKIANTIQSPPKALKTIALTGDTELFSLSRVFHRFVQPARTRVQFTLPWFSTLSPALA